MQLTWLWRRRSVLHPGLGPQRARLQELVPAEQRGQAFGWFHFATGILILPANLLFGWLYTQSAWLAFGFPIELRGRANLRERLDELPLDVRIPKLVQVVDASEAAVALRQRSPQIFGTVKLGARGLMLGGRACEARAS